MAARAAVFSVLGILLLSAIFVTANRLIFANATDREIPLPPISPDPIVLTRTDAVPEGFPFPEFYIHHMGSEIETSPNALTAEEAALLGAKYIWEMFGVDISDTSMYVGYSRFPTSTRYHWGGQVGVFGALYPAPDWYVKWLFSFAIDSVTGERIEIHDYRKDEIEVFGETVSGGGHQRLVEIFKEIAEIYAERHFNFTEIVSISYEGMRNMDDHRIYFQGDDGQQHFRITGDLCCHIWNGETLLSFTATDETGRSANLAISMETQRLAYLTTRHNDIIPGWESAPSGGRYPMEEYGPWLDLYLGPNQRITAMQEPGGVDSHIFYQEQVPTLTLSHTPGQPTEQQYISMDFTGELFPLNVQINRRRVDQIGHHYSSQFIYFVAPGGWTPGLYEYMITIIDDGYDWFYFMRATWPEGITTYIFRVNSGNPELREYPWPTPTPMSSPVPLPWPPGHGITGELPYGVAWIVEPTLDHGRIRNCSCGMFTSYIASNVDTITGQPAGSGCGGHGGPGPRIVFDQERQLLGHTGNNQGLGYHELIGMHPIDVFVDMLVNDWGGFDWWRNPTDGLIAIENVDSSRRKNYDQQEYVTYVPGYHERWHLSEDAFTGRFALMYNRQFVTNFAFDGAHEHFINWQKVTDLGIAAVSLEGRWGLVDRRGTAVIPFIFENLLIIDQNTAFARHNGLYGIIDIPRTVAALGGA